MINRGQFLQYWLAKNNNFIVNFCGFRSSIKSLIDFNWSFSVTELSDPSCWNTSMAIILNNKSTGMILKGQIDDKYDWRYCKTAVDLERMSIEFFEDNKKNPIKLKEYRIKDVVHMLNQADSLHFTNMQQINLGELDNWNKQYEIVNKFKTISDFLDHIISIQNLEAKDRLRTIDSHLENSNEIKEDCKIYRLKA